MPHIPPLCFLRPWRMSSTAHHSACEYYERIKQAGPSPATRSTLPCPSSEHSGRAVGAPYS